MDKNAKRELLGLVALPGVAGDAVNTGEFRSPALTERDVVQLLDRGEADEYFVERFLSSVAVEVARSTESSWCSAPVSQTPVEETLALES